MQKLVLTQRLGHKLSPQQIKFIHLLQVPSNEMHTRVIKELEENPALEHQDNSATLNDVNLLVNPFSSPKDDIQVKHENTSYATENTKSYSPTNYFSGSRDLQYENPYFVNTTSLSEQLLHQLSFLKLNVTQQKIGKHLIGSLEPDGYIRRSLDAIVDDLAFTQYIETNEKEVEKILKKIQAFEPAGIAARDLQECLLLQLKRRDINDLTTKLAVRILSRHFKAFSQKHYDQLRSKLHVSEDQLKKTIQLVRSLNPKPGGFSTLQLPNRHV